MNQDEFLKSLPSIAEQERISDSIMAEEVWADPGGKQEQERLLEATWRELALPEEPPRERARAANLLRYWQERWLPPTVTGWQAVWADPNSTPAQRKAAEWNLTEEERRAAEHGRSVSRLQLKCSRCGKQFEARRTSAQFCSESCKSRAKRDRQAGRETQFAPR